MARARNPKRDEAFELFKKHDGKITNREIASILEIPEKTISAWKSRDKWNAALQKKDCSTTNEKRSTTNKGGAPQGNQNAVGNKGNSRASPPKRNKNALKTGEYETIFADFLSDDEKDIYANMDDDPFFVLSEEVRLLKVRQYRMMRRIKEAEAGLNQEEIERLQQLRKVKEPASVGEKVVTIKREVLKDVQITRKTFRKIEDIINIEDALTRISNQLTKAIKQLNELTITKSKQVIFERQSEKLDAEIRRLRIQNGDSEPEEIADDGFMDAIKNIANDDEVWDDDNIET